MFQFKNIQTNETLTLNFIDELAANFWGKELKADTYAYPGEGSWISHNPNWFDILGHAIEDLQYFSYKNDEGKIQYRRSKNVNVAEFDMAEVASMIVGNFNRHADSAKEIIEMTTALKPYLDLCFHLKSLDIIGVGLGW